MRHAIGISIHTGWGVCVVAGGSLLKPQIVANEVIEMLGDAERFCFHTAAEMQHDAAQEWIAHARHKAVGNARRALTPLIAHQVSVCALVAKQGDAGELGQILASHPRMHTAEGFFYRDVLLAACTVPTRIVPPQSLDVAKVGKLAPPPWGRDQKIAALAAWSVMES